MKPYLLICYDCGSKFEDIYPKYRCPNCSKAGSEKSRLITEDLRNGLKQIDIAIKHGVTKQYVCAIKKKMQE